ncbi:MAG: AtpZ/AtpI family protein [Acidobacteria bacterium]|nr:AtpZ/AtpI family protein [Acidobacteriota bacterium]
MNSLFNDDDAPNNRPQAAVENAASFQDEKNESSDREGSFEISEARPESFAETARKSGLAYSAAIALFASVIFMLVLGWLADLLFGSSPWGIVGGIVLGSLIGFVQFFRITSRIFHK